MELNKHVEQLEKEIQLARTQAQEVSSSCRQAKSLIQSLRAEESNLTEEENSLSVQLLTAQKGPTQERNEGQSSQSSQSSQVHEIEQHYRRLIQDAQKQFNQLQSTNKLLRKEIKKEKDREKDREKKEDREKAQAQAKQLEKEKDRGKDRGDKDKDKGDKDKDKDRKARPINQTSKQLKQLESQIYRLKGVIRMHQREADHLQKLGESEFSESKAKEEKQLLRVAQDQLYRAQKLIGQEAEIQSHIECCQEEVTKLAAKLQSKVEQIAKGREETARLGGVLAGLEKELARVRDSDRHASDVEEEKEAQKKKKKKK